MSASPADVERLMYAGRVMEAVELAAAEIEQDTSDLEAQEMFIDLMLTLRMPNRVIPVYRERAANNPLSPDAHYLVGRCVTDADDARQAYEKALRLDPDHARSHMGMAAVHLVGGDLESAEAAYRRALKLDSSLSEAWQGLAKLLADQGRADEALQVSREAMKAVPASPDPYLTAAILSPGEAPELLRKAQQNAPQDPRVHGALAEVRLLTGDAAGALEDAARALDIQPGFEQALVTTLFAEAMAGGRLDQAGYRDMLAAQRLEQDSPEKALSAYDALVERYPECDLTWMARSRARLILGDEKGALQDLDRTLELDPRDVEAHAAKGLILWKTRGHAAAVPHLKLASASRPQDASLAVALGESAIAVGDVSGGTTVLAKAHSRFPYDVRVVLSYAQALSEQGDALGAYKVVREASGRVPDPRLFAVLVVAAEQAGRYAEAATLLEKVADETGNARLREAAAKLRTLAEAP